MEVGMTQFRVKTCKNEVMDEQTRVSKYYPRVYYLAAVFCLSDMNKLEFKTPNSSLGLRTRERNHKLELISVFSIFVVSGLGKLESISANLSLQ